MNKWPKIFPELTPSQKQISDDFMRYWHEVLPKRYGIIDRFNHEYAVRNAPTEFVRTLEIGAGLGEHLKYERLTEVQMQNYVALDIRENMIKQIKERFPEIDASVGDCQSRLNFDDGFFDRILAIHVLEHLPNLPAAIKELYRLCNKQSGVFSIVIPCEGSMAYSLARRISAQRVFESRYRQPYKWFIEREHINRPKEILEEVAPYFRITHRKFFPIQLPILPLNLCVGLTLKPKAEHVGIDAC